MKKSLILIFTVLFTLGTLWGCKKAPETGIPGSDSAKELISKVRYTSTYSRNDTVSESEMVMNYTWSQNGARMEGYQQESGEKSDMRLEATLDEQKRPLSMTKTYTGTDETSVTTVNFTYPSPLQVHIQSTNSNDYSYEFSQTYDEQGRIVLAEYSDYTRGFEFDSHGNCIREWMEYDDEEMTDWESTTVYTYDDSGKIMLAVETRSDSEHEEQRHYTYYPNGNVMSILYVTNRGDTNFVFRPYNTKDYLGWSYGMAASAGGDYQVEKDERGYIVKVQRTVGHSDEVQTATFDYDDRGNLVKEVTFSGTVFTREYDSQNRLVKQVEDQSQSYSQTVQTTVYEYDAQGRLVSESMTGSNGSSTIQTLAYNEAGMVTERFYKNVSIYDNETVTTQRKLEIEYIENDQCAASESWKEFFVKNLISGV